MKYILRVAHKAGFAVGTVLDETLPETTMFDLKNGDELVKLNKIASGTFPSKVQ